MDAAARLRDHLLDNLRSRRWRAGQRLPTERSLSEQYALSRSTVRRVMHELKQRRLITQTVGSGTYVAEEVDDALGAMMAQAGAQAVSPAELMAARIALEPALIELVIANAAAADFARMDDCCRQGEAATRFEDFERWDAALHEAIAAASHNRFMIGVFRLINAARAQAEWGVMKRRSATAQRRAAYQQEHRALVAALKDRDAERARSLCRAHLLHVRRNLLGA